MSLSDPITLTADILDALDAGIVIVDNKRCIQHWNAWMENFSGRSASELLGVPLWTAFPDLARSSLMLAVNDALDIGAPSLLTHTLNPSLFELRLHDGRPMLHNIVVRPLRVAERTYCILHVTDVTTRWNAQNALSRSEARSRIIFDRAAIGIAEVDMDGRFLRVNDRLCAITGYSREEMLERRFQDITLPDDLDADLSCMRQLCSGQIPSYSLEKRYVRKDGSTIWIHLTSSLVRDQGQPSYFVATMEDISRRKATEEEREMLLRQKDLLMQEVHHRTKNSLALVASLLSVQSRSIAAPNARLHLVEAYRRVLTVSQVHERLYGGRQATDRVELGGLLEDLCGDLAASVMALERGQRVQVCIAERVELTTDVVIPVALIVTELVTNAIKYAHPDGSPGTILVECLRPAQNLLIVRVADDGIGLPTGFKLDGRNGLGMRVITVLTKQLGATLEIGQPPAGAEFQLRLGI